MQTLIMAIWHSPPGLAIVALLVIDVPWLISGIMLYLIVAELYAGGSSS
jgi:hypothetical protein